MLECFILTPKSLVLLCLMQNLFFKPISIRTNDVQHLLLSSNTVSYLFFKKAELHLHHVLVVSNRLQLSLLWPTLFWGDCGKHSNVASTRVLIKNFFGLVKFEIDRIQTGRN